MRTWLIGGCAALAACAGTVTAESAKTPVPVWDLAKDAFAATTGRIERVNGRVAMDGDSVDLYALLKDRLDLAAGDQYHWSGDAYQLIAEALRTKCDEVLSKAK